MNSMVVRKLIKGAKREGYEDVVHTHIDLTTDSMNIILTKPFFEKIKSLI